MRRYRAGTFMIDGTRQTLTRKDMPQEYKENMLDWIKERYGTHDHKEKVDRYIEVNPPNFMIVPDYIKTLNEIRDAYIFGNYYPALTGACYLGERILNILTIRLRDHFKKHRRYNWAKRHDLFTDWKPCIELLLDWNVLTYETTQAFKDLEQIRHVSIHFDNLQDPESRTLRAVNLIFKITDNLFGVNKRNFFWAPGAPYIRKDREEDPMIKEFILPRCILVTYKHYLETDTQTGNFIVRDDPSVPEKEVTDEEFAKLEEGFRESPEEILASQKTGDN